MQVTRRTVTLGLSAGFLTGCSGGVTSGPDRSFSSAESWPTARNAGFDSWLAGFRGRAASRGVNAATLDSALRSAGYIPKVIERDRNQVEFRRTLEDYLAIAASDERVATGRQKLAQYRGLLGQLESRFGVPGEVVTAIWGLESRFGARRGDVPVISALATLAYDGRRGPFFEQQLVAALKILQNGDTTPARMTGSWAGAMGHTQFIPTSYLEYAVDFTGDGRRDIWSDDPTDALASAAAYLSRFGWVRGMKWGGEVGNGAPQGRIIQPQAGGPRFSVTRNFDVIKRYNNSDSYALGVGHLSDRIAGGGPLRGSFPPDANGMTLENRKELQQLLTRRGFDAGGADGVIGRKTEAAISAYQSSAGLPVTGTPSLELLSRLRG